MKIKIIIVVVLLAVGAVIASLYLFPSEKAKIKKQFDYLSSLVSKEKGESAIVMGYRVTAIGGLFAEKCSFEFPQNEMEGEYSPEEITAHTTRGRAMFAKINLKFYDINPEIQNDDAVVDTTVRFYGEAIHSNKAHEETREIQCKLKKIDGKWKFSNFKVVEVLKK
ncbi:MAG TPA: hypothetical protein DCZ94_08675 [Lentisphaeria bacterium]|nr:MAG: hypothetical protein A2X48_12440 [Lentisphaerae bacterium GWF2_49_21]HBC87013.1 hypothetical protein [Lentisphaeria bacterium]